ncbi:hypothetical protein PENDEC_c006G04645 [Penicillium decumbens]|uniref:Uncharacterized protein n=1 Tax=Penicillium decumbens TaxID=69771 RepID=A0A1V6PFI6_PENDC|nr:hypothetical protein PENDEC_c006G04645 [Penicillium decumbens]
MASSAIGMSNATFAPSNSASQARKAPRSAPPAKGGSRKGSFKPKVGKDASQGAVKAPAGEQKKTGKASTVVSTAIPLSGWSRYPSGGQHLSLGLFRYYGFTLWLRVLWLHKSNTNVLTTDEKNTLNILSDEEFFVRSHIAQYLANMGNFTHGGDNFYFLKFNAPPGSFDADDMVVKEVWFEVGGNGPGHVTESEFWHYAQLPAPGVYTSFVCNEANNFL